MRRVIMLLPNPDLLQLANCHKYVTRGKKPYSDIYTMATVANACADVDKILVIGHGEVGGFKGATIDEVVGAIIASKIPLSAQKKIGFDTCYAGLGDNASNIPSAMHAVRVRLKKHDFNCNLELSGAMGPSVTIGNVGDKRLVVKPSNLGHAGAIQTQKTRQHGVNLFAHRPDWDERTASATIKMMAQEEHARLLPFAVDFRGSLGADLDLTTGRKVTLQV